MTANERTCSYDGCGNTPRGSSRICQAHRLKEWRARQGPCKSPKCPRQAAARGLCEAHYQCWRAGGDWQVEIPQRMKTDGVCLRGGCDEPVHSRGYCSIHYQRIVRNGDVGPVERRKARRGEGNISKGYRYITVDGRRIAEHRYLMEQIIGRPLYPFETPHHKNGRRADNRPENLELWVKPQLAGQRVEDLIAFVVEHYPSEVRKALPAE